MYLSGMNMSNFCDISLLETNKIDGTDTWTKFMIFDKKKFIKIGQTNNKPQQELLL